MATTPTIDLFQVGHIYLNCNKKLRIALWREQGGSELSGRVSEGDTIFVVATATLVKPNNPRAILCWKVMTSKQEMGWLELYEDAAEHWLARSFKEVTPLAEGGEDTNVTAA